MQGDISGNVQAITALDGRVDTLESVTSGHTSSISALSGRVDSLETASTGQAGDITSLQNTVSTQGENISALQSAVESLQQDGGVPAGFIGLYNSTTPPTGFAVCDGTGGTPKLTGYTAGTLRYIRKS